MKLNAESLSLSFDGSENKVFDNLNINLDSGSMTLLTGENGSGKTLLGISLSGLLPLFSGNWHLEGRIEADGVPLVQGEPCRDISIVLENPHTQLSGLKRSVLQELAFPLECRGVKREEILNRIELCADIFGITDILERKLRTLSGGELQRIILACAMIAQPTFLFLDRPLTELDREFRQNLLSHIKDFVNTNSSTALLAEDRWLLEGSEFSSQISLHESDQSLPVRDSDPYRKPTGQSVLEIEDLNFSYDCERQLIKDFSLKLYAGELLFLGGRNGAGKTTLAQLITGILSPESGHIVIDTMNAVELDEMEIINLVGYSLQDPSIQLCRSTVSGELELAERCGNPVGEFTDILGLRPFLSKHPFELLYAEKKRLSIALACGGNRKLIILDEPSQNQDMHSFVMTVNCIRHCLEKGQTVIVISHDPRFRECFPNAWRISLD